ncbi:MAG: translation initiation factor IF-3 [Candidatus Moeniiplasma glomeromycotorum]|nr:translation initiation factor IF-3 [Candidatus Moeniiplasma glomeromycotorum]MCE8169421.1 translation initiation factor IF-3 [Candidatus Moeniiplasma glomeromycotorum]
MILKNKKNEQTQFLNENIPFSRVLLVVSKEEKEVLDREEALKRAKKASLDLFCVAPDKNPPVCKLINFHKHLFELSKEKKSKKENICKEIGIKFSIKNHDLKIKLEKVWKLIEKGIIVKVKLIMVGKEKAYLGLGKEKCQQIIAELQNLSPKIKLRDDIHQHFGSLYFFVYKKKQ